MDGGGNLYPIPSASCYKAILGIDNACASSGIYEEILTLGHIVDIDFLLLVDPRQDIGRREQLQRVPQTDLDSMFGDLVKGGFGDCQALRLRSYADDVLDFIWGICVGGYDEDAGKEIRRDPVSGDDVFRASYGAFATIRGKYDDGCDGRFESAVEVGEAFDVEHVDLLQESQL